MKKSINFSNFKQAILSYENKSDQVVIAGSVKKLMK